MERSLNVISIGHYLYIMITIMVIILLKYSKFDPSWFMVHGTNCIAVDKFWLLIHIIIGLKYNQTMDHGSCNGFFMLYAYYAILNLNFISNNFALHIVKWEKKELVSGINDPIANHCDRPINIDVNEIN